MLVANSYVIELLLAIDGFSQLLYTLQGDIQQIPYEDSLCLFRGYALYVLSTVHNYSFFLQALYRYLIVVHPNRLRFQSFRFQFFLICVAWIVAFIYPLEFFLRHEVKYDINSQACLLILQVTFSVIYMALCSYTFANTLTVLIYFTLVYHLKQMRKHITPANSLARAQKELNMIRRIIILVLILFTFGIPYMVVFLFIVFDHKIQHDLRIASIFMDSSIVITTIILIYFTEPLKTSIMKRIKRRTNMVVARVA
ncbi:unnamed protein product [Didymodactylos carnosus]|uniref:G-protein coupled receptors family 1 profile domain-containing protein n=1 Tax=Didymodactylos carnosus TaxID=1234261 RepID=A0A815TSF7_9BILA|nr:unnamed protein product [Didymodactylos carnosus]CAF1512406.1 unnamed protein product [Didymodactylos carnosus]CAF4173639.1 unnamed protein product [Didymodactylos carnosus]CAF4372886.1 unnamed protein product [Didymodactylos carnosus]